MTFFYFGVIGRRRGIIQFIHAIEKLSPQYSFHLKVIGPIDKADKDLFESYFSKHSSWVEHIPWIDISELLTQISTADICIAPFLKTPQCDSGVANKIFQYMFAGKSILAANCVAQEELIKIANCGWIFGTQDELEVTLKEIFESPEKWSNYGQNGKSYLYENYSNESQIATLRQLYESLNI